MTIKQAIICFFMVLFLAAALVSAGLWLHLTGETARLAAEAEALKADKARLEAREKRVAKQITGDQEERDKLEAKLADLLAARLLKDENLAAELESKGETEDAKRVTEWRGQIKGAPEGERDARMRSVGGFLVAKVLQEPDSVLARAIQSGENAVAVAQVRDQLLVAQGAQRRLDEAKKRADQRLNDVYLAKEALEPREAEVRAEFKDAWGDAGKVAQAWKAAFEESSKSRREVRDGWAGVVTQDREDRKQLAGKDAELRAEMANEDNLRKEDHLKRQKWSGDLATLQNEVEDLNVRRGHMMRSFERRRATEVAGAILFASPEVDLAVADVGTRQGARPGLVFNIYSGRYKTPVLKGQLKLTTVRRDTSDGIILPVTKTPLRDRITGWEATDPAMRFSPFVTGGEKGTDPAPLTAHQTRRDRVQQLEDELRRRDKGDEPEAQQAEKTEQGAQPPYPAGKALEPVAEGDYLTSPEFSRVASNREFSQYILDLVKRMEKVSLKPVVFYITDSVKPFRREFVRRLIERSRCRLATAVSGEVTFVVTTEDADSVAKLEKLKDVPDEKATPDQKNKKATLAALQEAQKFNTQVLTDDQVEEYFELRERKIAFIKGDLIRPGVSVFFVAGQFRRRDQSDTCRFIESRGGIVSSALTPKVDYIVIGTGLENAKLDKATGRLYELPESAPAGAVSFLESLKQVGGKVIREDDLYSLFPEPASRP